MEQQRGEILMQQQEQPLAPVKCPRCESMDTKFRYFNNNNPKQPRHYCKTCKRQWTVGGNLRDIPIGGTKRTKQTKVVSSSICDNPMYRFLHPQLPPAGDSLQYTVLPAVEAMVPQHFDTTMIQPVTNLSETAVSSSLMDSYIFNDDMSCLDDIQSFMHPDLEYQSPDVGNDLQLGGASNVHQSIASQHALAPQFPEYQTHGHEANINAGPYNFSNYNSSQFAWPVNSLPTEDIINNYTFSTSTANTTDTIMPTTSVNQNQWPNFPSYGPP